MVASPAPPYPVLVIRDPYRRHAPRIAAFWFCCNVDSLLRLYSNYIGIIPYIKILFKNFSIFIMNLFSGPFEHLKPPHSSQFSNSPCGADNQETVQGKPQPHFGYEQGMDCGVPYENKKNQARFRA